MFTRVKNSQDPPNKEFTRNVRQNLNFRVGRSNDIRVDVHKNRRNPLDPVVVSFKVKGVPKYDIPKPVMLKKKAPDIEKDKVRNIPCPYDDCEELLSREEFRGHLNQHRQQNKSSENMDNVEYVEKNPEDMTNNENIVPLKMEMKNNSDVVDGACSNVKFDEEKDKNDVTLDKMDVTEDSVEIVEIKSADSLNKSKQSEKQSSILSFFKRFDRDPRMKLRRFTQRNQNQIFCRQLLRAPQNQ